MKNTPKVHLINIADRELSRASGMLMFHNNAIKRLMDRKPGDWLDRCSDEEREALKQLTSDDANFMLRAHNEWNADLYSEIQSIAKRRGLI